MIINGGDDGLFVDVVIFFNVGDVNNVIKGCYNMFVF